MDLDFTAMIVGGLSIVIVMLIIYIAYRFREERVTLTGLSVDDLLKRIEESEQILQAIKEERCWNCGSKDKEVVGNLYDQNEIRFVCKQCGTETIWKKGKKEWKVSTGTKSFLALLDKRVKEEKSRM